MQQVPESEYAKSNSRWFYRVGGSAALIAGLLLVMGLISLTASVLLPGIKNDWLSPFENNWLIVIFKLHAEFGGMQTDLFGLNFLDIFILTLVGIICLCFGTILRKSSKTWSFIAFALSLIAVILFVVTQLTGRSTVMLAVLIISFVFLKDKTFNKTTIVTGILASILLFAGDLTVGVHSDIITFLFGFGYLLLIVWFFLIARSLVQSGQLS